ncbi:MAG: molybdopterin molybdotransferase MoeA [Nitrososphaerales archaeon]
MTDHVHYHGVDKAEAHPTVSEALKTLLESIVPVKPETVGLLKANNRVLFGDVKSPIDLPRRARSTRDGFAVNIPHEVEAGQSFKIISDVRIGTIPKLFVKPYEAARVATGSNIPSGANAVLMVEYGEVQGKTLLASKAIKMKENLLAQGEDIAKNQPLLSGGTRFRAQHIALFSMLGIESVRVFSKPKIAFFSTGDELVDLEKSKTKQKSTGIYDANRPFIAAMISELGAIPVDLGIAKDNFGVIKTKMLKGLRCDALILSAGSSVGERDYVARAANSIHGVRILVHGVAMRPSSPTGIASYKGKPIILLPGFPTSAIISFFVFANPAILRLSGCTNVEQPMIRAKLVEEYDGKPGLAHFVRVKVSKENSVYKAKIARPTEAQYSRWLQSANGIAVIDEKGVGRPDEIVDVFLIAEVS